MSCFVSHKNKTLFDISLFILLPCLFVKYNSVDPFHLQSSVSSPLINIHRSSLYIFKFVVCHFLNWVDFIKLKIPAGSGCQSTFSDSRVVFILHLINCINAVAFSVWFCKGTCISCMTTYMFTHYLEIDQYGFLYELMNCSAKDFLKYFWLGLAESSDYISRDTKTRLSVHQVTALQCFSLRMKTT